MATQNTQPSSSQTQENKTEWVSLTVYLFTDVYEQVAEILYSKLKIENAEIRRSEKRELHTAMVLVAMNNEDEVVKNALSTHRKINNETEWKSYNIYLPNYIHEYFNEDFFMLLKLGNTELKQCMKRTLHQAALETAMNNETELIDVMTNDEYKQDIISEFIE